MHKPVIIDQNSAQTVIKCPRCGARICLYHECQPTPKPNDGIGRLDLGDQNYGYVVCMDKTCLHAEDMRFGPNFEYRLPG